MLWETSYLIWGTEWCDWCATTQWRWRTSRTRGARDRTLWLQMTIRLLKWCDSKAITLVPVHLPGVRNIQVVSLSRVGQTLTTEWTMAMESLRTVFAKWGEPQIDMFATFANRRLVSSYRHIRTPGWSGQMPCPCPGTRRGASCTPSRHLRWSRKFCRRWLNHQECRWYWSLNCNRQHHGSQSWWT